MKCPYCSHENTRVIDSRPAEDNNSIRRRRVCDECGKRFTTYEKIETIPLIVIKKDENREPYDRSKIEAGVLRACHKRPISINQINQLVDEVETEIFNREEKEIPSRVIGELVMVFKVAMPGRFQFKIYRREAGFLTGRQGDVHYIGGSEVLPPPLEADKENAVISDLGTEYEDEAKSILIEHNLRLVVYIAKKFDNTGVGVEDLISIGTIGLIKSINTFNPQKNIKLATYASRCIENEILMYLRRNNKTKLEVSIDEPLNVDWDGNELLLSDILGTDEDVIYRDIETEVERKLLLKAVDKLSDREKTIINLRFGLSDPSGKELTQKEVAEMLGISQSYISRLEKKIMKRLKKELIQAVR